MSALAKLSWLLYNTTNVVSLIVSIVYWSFLFDPSGGGLRAMDFFVHGFNSIASLADIFIGKRPCLLQHFYQPLLLMIAYLTFCTIYWDFDGRNENGQTFIYPILDWNNKPIETLVWVLGGILVTLPLHFVLWLLHRIRNYLCSTYSKSDDVDDAGVRLM